MKFLTNIKAQIKKERISLKQITIQKSKRNIKKARDIINIMNIFLLLKIN